jgi:hypothetical protein
MRKTPKLPATATVSEDEAARIREHNVMGGLPLSEMKGQSYSRSQSPYCLS